MKKQFSLIATVVVAAFSLFSACKKEEEPVKYGHLNIIHTSPDAPGFNVYNDSTIINPFVLLYGANTGYLPLEVGSKSLRAHTYRVDSTDTLLVKADVTLKENQNYSLFFIDSAKKISSLFVPDDLNTPPNGKAKIRFINLSPDTIIVNVVNHLTSGTIFRNLAFKDNTGFTEVNSGVYDWDLRNKYTDALVYRIPTLVLSSGKIYTVYTQGFRTAEGPTALSSAVIVNKN